MITIRKYLLLLAVLLLGMAAEAKKYPFDMDHTWKIEQIRVAQDETRLVKAWGTAGNADKAITRALQDAVAALIFEGIPACQTAGEVPPLCSEGRGAYESHKDYFDNFFVSGEFLRYVENMNSRYPTGENNVSVKGGRQVGIYARLDVKQLRKRLEADGIIKSLENVFDR